MATSPAIEVGGLVRVSLFSDGASVPETINVVSVLVKKAINRVPLAEIVILDGDMPDKDFPVSNADHFKPGALIKINAGYEQDEDTIFEGIVVKHGIKISGSNYSRLVVECRDKSVAMTVGRKNANYVDQKDSDIVSTILGRYGALTSDVGSTTTQYKELVQYYCTDWDFMLSRAEANGFVVIADGAKVTFKAPKTDGSAALKITYGESIVDFQADLDARMQLSSVQSASWDIKNQAVTVQQSAPQTLNSQGDLDSAQLATVLGLDSFVLQTSSPIESTALKAWADGQQVKSGLSRIRGSVKFQGSAKAKIGELMELEGVGNRFNGSVYVSSICHRIADGNWFTEAEFGMSSDWFAESRDLVAPPASGLLPAIEGLHIGVVMKLDEDPDGQYKIKVSTPVMQAETDGVWARLTKFYASSGIGAFFVPEIGDEVVLGYFNNDPSSPVILGSLYSSKRKPPYEFTADNYTKAIVTKSKLKLEFDDDKKIITVITPGENKIVVSDDGQSILLQDQNNNKVKLSSDGILLDSPSDISIKATGKISLSATGNVEIESQADVKASGLNIEHNAQVGFTAKGNASAEISASGNTTVKGAMVMIN